MKNTAHNQDAHRCPGRSPLRARRARPGARPPAVPRSLCNHAACGCHCAACLCGQHSSAVGTCEVRDAPNDQVPGRCPAFKPRATPPAAPAQEAQAVRRPSRAWDATGRSQKSQEVWNWPHPARRGGTHNLRQPPELRGRPGSTLDWSARAPVAAGGAGLAAASDKPTPLFSQTNNG